MGNKTNTIITEAIGAGVLNKSFNEDYIFGYISSRMKLTEKVKKEVKEIIEKSKKYLVD